MSGEQLPLAGGWCEMRAVHGVIMKRLEKDLLPDDPGAKSYGHYWFEIGDPLDPASESFGWWPVSAASRIQALTGVPGALNRNLPRDPHHGDRAPIEFHPEVADDDTRTDAEIADCLRTFARAFSSRRWQWPIGPNCITFQREAMRHCRLRTPKGIAP